MLANICKQHFSKQTTKQIECNDFGDDYNRIAISIAADSGDEFSLKRKCHLNLATENVFYPLLSQSAKGNQINRSQYE